MVATWVAGIMQNQGAMALKTDSNIEQEQANKAVERYGDPLRGQRRSLAPLARIHVSIPLHAAISAQRPNPAGTGQPLEQSCRPQQDEKTATSKTVPSQPPFDGSSALQTLYRQVHRLVVMLARRL